MPRQGSGHGPAANKPKPKRASRPKPPPTRPAPASQPGPYRESEREQVEEHKRTARKRRRAPAVSQGSAERGGRPSESITVKRKGRNPDGSKKRGTRTFKNAEEYQQYRDRLARKKQIVREAVSTERQRQRYQPRYQKPGEKRETAAEVRESQRKELAAKRREAEREAAREGKRLQRQHRKARKLKVPGEGTTHERGVEEATHRKAQEREEKIRREEREKRRGGGVGQLLENAKDEAIDTVAGAPASAKALAEVGLEQGGRVTGAARDVAKGTRRAYRRRTPKTDKLIKDFKDTSPLVALAKGDVNEALGRAKERPLAAVGEAAIVAGPAGAAARTVTAATRSVHRGTGVKGTRAEVRAGREAARARPDLQTPDKPARRAKGRKARKAVREQAATTRARTQDAAAAMARGDAQAAPSPGRGKKRRYAKNAAVRGAQKTADRAKGTVGLDPNVAGKRASRKARKRLFDVDVRNLQAAGIAREEKADTTVRKATRRMKPREKAAVELLVNARVRPESADADLRAVRQVIADNPSPARERNLQLVDELLADQGAFTRKKVRRAADTIAAASKDADARQVKAGYAEPGRLDFVARLQGPLARGEVVPREGGASSPSPVAASAPRRGQRRDVMAENLAARGITVHERAGGGSPAMRPARPARAASRAKMERDLKELEAEIRTERAWLRQNREASADRRAAVVAKIEGKSTRAAQLLDAIEAQPARENAPAHEAFVGGDAPVDIDTNRDAIENPGKMAGGSGPARPRRVRQTPDPASSDGPSSIGPASSGRGADAPSGSYVWASGPLKGKGVHGDDFDGEAPAFLRGTQTAKPGDDRTLRRPEAREGYQLDDLLGPIGRGADTDLLQRERRMTLAQLHDAVVQRHATGGQVHSDEAAARAAAADGDVVIPVGDGYVALPEFLAKRVRGQLDPAGRATAFARWGTRQFVRAALPFSISWHAGNTVDLQIRLALSLPPGTAREGKQAHRALERQLGQLDPDLRGIVLDSLKGHFGSRQTVRDPRFADVLRESRLESVGKVTNAVGDFAKATGGRIVDKAFDVSSNLEKLAVDRAVGAEAVVYARELGIHVKDHQEQMRQLAGQLQRDPYKVIELQDRVLEIVGDFATRSTLDRRMLAGVDPFWKWLRASTRFVLRTLPERHPKRTAMLLIAASMTADERARAGLNYYWDEDALDRLHVSLDYRRQREGFLAGALGAGDDVMPVAPLTSFGEVAGLAMDPARLAGRPLSMLQRPAAAQAGYWRTPGELGVKALPGGGEVDDLEIPALVDQDTRARSLAAETFVPGVKQARTFRERGGRPQGDSTLLDPKTIGRQGTYADGLSAIANPAHRQYAPQDPISSEEQRLQDPMVPVGGAFPVHTPNGEVYWIRREQ